MQAPARENRGIKTVGVKYPVLRCVPGKRYDASEQIKSCLMAAF